MGKTMEPFFKGVNVGIISRERQIGRLHEKTL